MLDRITLFLVVALLAIGFSNKLCAQPHSLLIGDTPVEFRTVAEDLKNPWDMVAGPEGEIWFSTRQGLICRLNPATTHLDTLHTIKEVAVSSVENSGLHALALHPQFPDSPFVYTHYAYDSLGARLVRWRYYPHADSLGDSLRIIPHHLGARSHIGSRIQWDSDSTFLIAIGDAYGYGIAQDLNELPGKILRFLWDGRIPADNPFAGSPIWTWGHRNPQGLVVAPNGQVFSSEHGASTDDELNRIYKGRNYGWPEVQGYCNNANEAGFCLDSNVVEPLMNWTPTWAVCGIEYYDHPAIPELRGQLLLATLKATALLAIQPNADGDSILNSEWLFLNNFGRLRDVLAMPDGRIYICTSNHEYFIPQVPRGYDKIIELANPMYVEVEEEVLSEPVFKAYPNPSHGEVTIQMESLKGEEVNLSLVDLQGRVVWEEGWKVYAGQNRKKVVLKNGGVFFLVATGDNGKRILKLVVNNFLF